MALLNVEVWDATGTKRQEVQMPDDAPVNRILAVLLEKMNFPQYAPDGQPLSYKFHHRASGKQLIDEQTLGEVGVKNGDVLRLQPEITAGARSWLSGFCSALPPTRTWSVVGWAYSPTMHRRAATGAVGGYAHPTGGRPCNRACK
ncbi:MAG TPA: EsaB/YukD family protein [Tepidisphaeraceae bacterium]|jgi:hypothetical protein|nr:EsaB/YukD family protein [Tepidisphaeraceae bacterium]